MSDSPTRADGPLRSGTLVWRLRNPYGRWSRCLISDRDVIVWSGRGIVFSDRCPTPEAAAQLADELWTILVARGWEPAEDVTHPAPDRLPLPYPRACPECQAPGATIAYRRGHYVVLACDACATTWNDRERAAAADRRERVRPQMDRRQAA